MRTGERLLSKILDMQDAAAIKRFGLREHHFLTEAERKAFRFIEKYAKENRGATPDYLTVVAETSLNYEPTTDTYEFLVNDLKKRSLVERTYSFLQDNVADKFSKMDDPFEFLEFLQRESDRLYKEHTSRAEVGTDAVTGTEKFLHEYEDRKAGKSFKVWSSFLPSISEAIGGYSSNLYTWFGRSGRGKSVVTLKECIHAAMQGANVLIWSMEMTTYEVLARAYSMLSADKGVFNARLNGLDLEAGYSNKSLLMADLSEEYEKGFREFLKDLPNQLKGTLTIRGVDDEDFDKRGLRELEEDIIATKADVVLLDPFYYLDYERNIDGTNGGAAAQTSKKLRHMAGRLGCVIHAITQADETLEENDRAGVRHLRAPRRAEVKKTKALLEDAALVIGVDSLADEGEGIVSLSKGRNGGEGTNIEIIYLPNYGIVRELNEITSGNAEDFASVEGF